MASNPRDTVPLGRTVISPTVFTYESAPRVALRVAGPARPPVATRPLSITPSTSASKSVPKPFARPSSELAAASAALLRRNLAAAGGSKRLIGAVRRQPLLGSSASDPGGGLQHDFSAAGPAVASPPAAAEQPSARLTAAEWTAVRAQWLRRCGLGDGAASVVQSAEQLTAAASDLLCVICQAGYKDQSQLLLSCSHAFHETCLCQYEAAQRARGATLRCPVCRAAGYDALRTHEGRRLWQFSAAVTLQRWWRAARARRRFSRHWAAVQQARAHAHLGAGASAGRGPGAEPDSVERLRTAFHTLPARTATATAMAAAAETRGCAPVPRSEDALSGLLLESDENVAAAQRLRRALDAALARRAPAAK